MRAILFKQDMYTWHHSQQATLSLQMLQPRPGKMTLNITSVIETQDLHSGHVSSVML